MAEVLQIKLAFARFQHSENVTPLTFRHFATHPIPFQLGEDSVFSAGEFCTDFCFKGKGLLLGAGKLGFKEGTRVRDEDVHLEHGLAVNNIETGILLDGFGNHIYFARDSVSGFFVRLLERAGTAETMIEVVIAGKINRYGELTDYPEEHGHFASVLQGAKPANVFALLVSQSIPEASIVHGDLLICDLTKRPQPGDIAILPFGRSGKRFLLCRIHSLTSDKDLETFEASNSYPIPEKLLDTSPGQRFHWSPLAFGNETEEYFEQEADKEKIPLRAMPPEFVMATVLRLTRRLAF